MAAMGGKQTLTREEMREHSWPMLKVHSAPIIERDRQHGWQIVFWLGQAFDYETPFRAALSEVASILKPSEAVSLQLPPYAAGEDFVEGSLTVGTAKLKTYYEYSLGYLALMSADREALEAVAAKVLPFVSIDNA